MTLGIEQIVFKVGNTIYAFSGNQKNENEDFHNMTMLTMDDNKDLNVVSRKIMVDGIGCLFCNGFVLNDTHVLLYVGFSSIYALTNETDDNNMGVMYYQLQRNHLARPPGFKGIPGSPLQRQYQSSVITPDKSSFYIFGGIGVYENNTTDLPIIRFDLTTWAYTTYSNFQMLGGVATMLPIRSGVVVIAFGSRGVNAPSTGALYDTRLVFLFDTRTNIMSNQTVGGTPPESRAEATGTLGPDNECIYYFGGNNFDISPTMRGNIPIFNSVQLRMVSENVVVLNTSSWTWFIPNVAGPPGASRYGAFSILYTDNTIIVGGGGISNAFLNSDVSVLRNLPLQGQTLESANLQWFTNSELDNVYTPSDKLSTGAIAVYAIYRAVQSPSQVQIEVDDVDTMPAPDIRICSQKYGFDNTQNFSVICQVGDGSDCSRYFHSINNDDFYPYFATGFGRPSCQLFIPPPSLAFQPNPGSYYSQYPNKLSIKVISQDTTNLTAFFVTYYAPGYDPNRKLFNLSPENEKITDIDVINWVTSEKSATFMPNTFGASSYTYPTVSYSLTKTENLTDSGWNNIGFAYRRTSRLELTQHVGPLIAMPQSSVVAQQVVLLLTVAPNEFQITTSREIKSNTILSGFAQAGGVFGLFVAIQTLLFGFRPESPWGLVHRWSFGNLRKALANRLTSQFDKLKTPVPIVSPVHNRFSRTPTRSNMFLFETSPFIPTDEEEDTDGARIQRMEERLQLMELLFKSYYINDEVFRHLDEAIKKNAETSPFPIEKDRVLASDSSSSQTNEEIPMSQSTRNRKNSLTDPIVKID
ncbi:hypothetical protein K501DRAFT_265818 [Backusella circina FSU 941]|nr:hypothetical protein K501DRAFT_265818 [Backusella circina FSU 941]